MGEFKNLSKKRISSLDLNGFLVFNKKNLEWKEFSKFISVFIAHRAPWEPCKGEVKDEAEAPIGRNR
jgi:hypothetical protein